MVIAEEDGQIVAADGTSITVEYKTLGRKVYRLLKFERSNQDTCINQKPRVIRATRSARATSWPTVRPPRTVSWPWARTWSWPT